MDAFEQRFNQDIEKLKQLSLQTEGRVKVVAAGSRGSRYVKVELNYSTAPDASYPSKVQNKTEVTFELLGRYPLQEPVATITTPIYHPNVYKSGKICFGTKWLPSQNLDLLVKRVVQIITFDPTILNENSPANGDALVWYRKASKTAPNAFPTDRLETPPEVKKPKIKWNDKPTASNHNVEVRCPGCSKRLNVPKGKEGYATCPNCQNRFFVKT